MTNRHVLGPWLHRGKSDSVHAAPTPEQREKGYLFAEMIFQFHEEGSPSDSVLALVLTAPELLNALRETKRAEEYAAQYAHLPEAQEEIASAIEAARAMRDSVLAKIAGVAPCDPS